MKTGQLKDYAPQARRDFIAAVTDRAAFYGLTANGITEVQENGDLAIIAGRPFPRSVAIKRKRLDEQVRRHGFEQVMEQVAYTWFNRLVAIRFMELHGYLDHGYRVLSHPEGKALPEIVEHAEHVELPGLKQEKVIELKLDGNKEAELYRLLLVAQCNALSRAMPFLFESIDDETELLLPDNLLHSDSLIRKLVESIDAEDWQEVEIIGWLYQFYISEKKAEVIGKVVKSEDIPAATQLFTPNWIVKYLVQNSLGRQWVATYPNSPLKAQMEYYIEPAEQTPEVLAKLKETTPTSLNPEELTLLDPACGSGHILVEAYDLLKAMYQERGYRAKDIPHLILAKNLFGLEIDDRAAQLSAFALTMKARADDRRIFHSDIQPHVIAIHDSKGLDAKEITDALNAPILKEKAPPSGDLFEEIADDKTPLLSPKNLSINGDISQTDVAHLIHLFEYGKTFGSLIRIPQNLAERLPAIASRVEQVLTHGGMLERTEARYIYALCQQAGVLCRTFNVTIMNPPYMGGKYFPTALKAFAAATSSDGKGDLFALFIERGRDFTASAGLLSMVTMHGWMFLSSYQALRESLLDHVTICTLAHLGPRAFSAISGEVVQVAAFVMQRWHCGQYLPTFLRLIEGDENTKRHALSQKAHLYSTLRQSDFKAIPRSPIAYWATDAIRKTFGRGRPLEEVAKPRQGLATSDNARFLRLWHEVDFGKMRKGILSREDARTSGGKWFPYNKGGAFRKWYGNNWYVINWEDDGSEVFEYARQLYGSPTRTIKNGQFYFKPGITWGDITASSFSARMNPEGFVFDVKGSCGFPPDALRLPVLGLLCSKVLPRYMEILNPTTTFQVGDLQIIPELLHETDCSTLSKYVQEIVLLSKEDWDSAETSWDFTVLPLLVATPSKTTVASSICSTSEMYTRRLSDARRLETAINQAVICVYGLGGELEPDVRESDLTLHRADRSEEIRRLLSYGIGCMMGRYSLDKPGLIYAYCGSKGFDLSQYKTFSADRDGIIPLTDIEWFEDDTAKRFEEFIATAWPKEHLEDNLTFVAESLGPKSGESSRATIRRYLATGFYRHHLSMYKRRPIYWLFSSGKQRAFQALVYLHRYHEGTLSRMRTEYVVPLLGKVSARISHLDRDIAGATGKYRRDLEKEQATLRKQLAELQEYDEKLRHYADQRIALDLDDGVKVNYAKFGDLLAEVKAVTGGSDEE